MISIANDSYDDKLKVMMAAGDEADIVDIRGLAQVTQYLSLIHISCVYYPVMERGQRTSPSM